MKPFKKFRENLARLSIPFFNDRFLSKWEVHEQLLQEKYLHSYMPETKIFSKENLLEFAKKYKMIFIKPIHGSQGRNIFKLLQDQNHFSYQASFSEKSISIETVGSLDEIYNQLNNWQEIEFILSSKESGFLKVKDVQWTSACYAIKIWMAFGP